MEQELFNQGLSKDVDSPNLDVKNEILEDIYGSPESYDYSLVQLPDGMELDSVMLEKFNPLAKKYNLSNKSASELLNLAIEMQQKNMTKFKDVDKQLQDEEKNSYLKMLEDDEELASKSTDDYGQYIATASNGLRAVATDGFINLIKEKGLTHHPEFIKTFHSIGKMCESGRLPAVVNPIQKEMDIADILYGSVG